MEYETRNSNDKELWDHFPLHNLVLSLVRGQCAILFHRQFKQRGNDPSSPQVRAQHVQLILCCSMQS